MKSIYPCIWNSSVITSLDFIATNYRTAHYFCGFSRGAIYCMLCLLSCFIAHKDSNVIAEGGTEILQ